MAFYRCKCGHNEVIGSLPPAQCQGCRVCGYVPSSHPHSFITPEPHKFIPTAARGDVQPRCMYCHKTEEQVKEDLQ